jgi:hypothetical protein
MALSPALSRAARALLDLDIGDMVKRSGVPKAVIAEYEKGGKTPPGQGVSALKLAFEEAGIIFLGDDGGSPGVRLRNRVAQAWLRPDQLTSENDD